VCVQSCAASHSSEDEERVRAIEVLYVEENALQGSLQSRFHQNETLCEEATSCLSRPSSEIWFARAGSTECFRYSGGEAKLPVAEWHFGELCRTFPVKLAYPSELSRAVAADDARGPSCIGSIIIVTSNFTKRGSSSVNSVSELLYKL
jgi:hypothetical protein